MEFCDRTEADFVTEYLNYDFQVKVNKEVKNEVVENLKKYVIGLKKRLYA